VTREGASGVLALQSYMGTQGRPVDVRRIEADLDAHAPGDRASDGGHDDQAVALALAVHHFQARFRAEVAEIARGR
jgi:hypothetical protein